MLRIAARRGGEMEASPVWPEIDTSMMKYSGVPAMRADRKRRPRIGVEFAAGGTRNGMLPDLRDCD
jgi:hypothetical protein